MSERCSVVVCHESFARAAPLTQFAKRRSMSDRTTILHGTGTGHTRSDARINETGTNYSFSQRKLTVPSANANSVHRVNYF